MHHANRHCLVWCISFGIYPIHLHLFQVFLFWTNLKQLQIFIYSSIHLYYKYSASARSGLFKPGTLKKKSHYGRLQNLTNLKYTIVRSLEKEYKPCVHYVINLFCYPKTNITCMQTLTCQQDGRDSVAKWRKTNHRKRLSVKAHYRQ